MERRFKVYVYSEGDLPIAHDGPCKNIYSTEGRFIHEMEQGPGRFRTTEGESAHVYFMPFSVTWMVKYLYKPNSNDQNPLRRYVADYVNLISGRYPFWNRTNGADHFMVACHDWVSSLSLYIYICTYMSFSLFFFFLSNFPLKLFRYPLRLQLFWHAWVAFVVLFSVVIYPTFKASIYFNFFFTRKNE